MKYFFNNLKTWAVVLAVASAAPAVGQGPTTIPVTLPPIASDETVAGGSPADATYQHTGTDALLGYKGGPLQAMVWDDAQGNVYLSWDDNGTKGFIPVGKGRKLSDPDVVLARRTDPGEIFANVVCIDQNLGNGGRTVLFGYFWDGSTFVQTFNPLPLGNPATEHSHPNIDANRLGMTAIVWQQTKNSLTTVQVSSNDFPTYTFTQLVTFGRSYVAGGYIDTDVIGNCYFHLDGANISWSGAAVIEPPKGLFEQTLRPDVAISETDDPQNDPPVVSTTFIRHFVSGLNAFAIVDSLAVIQTSYNRCGDTQTFSSLTKVDEMEWTASLSSGLRPRGAPRIAATPSTEPTRRADVEVVLDFADLGCACNEPTYEVRNYGKSQGAFRQPHTLVSLPDQTYALSGCQASTNLRRREAKEPVVSYYPEPRGEKGHYVIAWTGFNYRKLDASDPEGGTGAEDVWANSFLAGVPDDPYPGTTIAQFYSAVNEHEEGNQHTPSVAGRHLLDNLTAHLFVDDEQSQLFFKRSPRIVGTEPLRPGPGTGPTSSSPRLLQAYPNPSESVVTVELQLHEGETVRQLSIVDQLGRQVESLPLTGEGQRQTLTWTPRPHLPSGTYVLRLVTSERTANTVINRK